MLKTITVSVDMQKIGLNLPVNAGNVNCKILISHETCNKFLNILIVLRKLFMIMFEIFVNLIFQILMYVFLEMDNFN